MKRNALLNSLMIWLGIMLIASLLSHTYAADMPASVVKETRSVGNFTKLDVSGAFEVFLVQGNACELVIEADEDIIDRVITKVSGSELEIYMRSPLRSYKKMKIYLTFEEIDEIELSGAVKLRGGNLMQFNKLDLELSGACDVAFEMEAHHIDLDLSGASKLSLIGIVEDIKADCSGASELFLTELKATHIDFESSGASTAKFWVTESLNVDGSGASDVRYKGEPKTVNVNASGATTVKKL